MHRLPNAWLTRLGFKREGYVNSTAYCNWKEVTNWHSKMEVKVEA